MNLKERLSEVRRLNWCLNCLCHGHLKVNCKCGYSKICKGIHHTLLHEANIFKSKKDDCNFSKENIKNEESLPTTTTLMCHQCPTPAHSTEIMLSTAIVNVSSEEGETIPVPTTEYEI